MWDPDWVEAMNVNPPDAWYWIEQRARWVASHWAGKIMRGILIMRWDMVIGILSFINSGPFGLTYLKQMVDWALEENPNLKIYHNDYGILNNNTYAFSYKTLWRQFKAKVFQ